MSAAWDLERLLGEGRKLCTEATPGSWEPLRSEEQGDKPGEVVVSWGIPALKLHECCECFEYPFRREADVAFIGGAREALPAALDEIERLLEAVADLQEVVATLETESKLGEEKPKT